jgi:hypothetical protein
MDKPFCFCVPYRDRAEHLRKFVAHYKELLPDVDIWVIEQNGDDHFNRVKLFNVFFKEHGDKYAYVIYHDVDMRIIVPRSNPDEVYAFPEQPTHLATYLSQLNGSQKNPDRWKESYPVFFGGIVALSRFQMEKSNGWSNIIASFGCDDDEMRQNLIAKGFPIHRRDAYFQCEEHPRIIVPHMFKKNAQYLREGRNDEIDGLSNCKYEIVSATEMPGYTRILVNL